MEDTHTYRVTAWRAAGQNGITTSDSAPNAIHFAPPPQFGGTQGRWSPEDLFLSSLASCFTITFSAIADHSQLSYLDLEVEVEGTVATAATDDGFTNIVICPSLRISAETSQERALQLLNEARASCLILRALDVRQEFKPQIDVNKPAVVGESFS